MMSSGGLNRHALRTAVISTVTVAALVAALCVAVDLIVATSLRSSAADRLTAQLTQLANAPGGPAFEEPDLDDPLLVWQLDESGAVVRATAGAPSLPNSARRPMAPSAISIAGNSLLIASERITGGLLVGAVSLANEFELPHHAGDHRSHRRTDPPRARVRWSIPCRAQCGGADRTGTAATARVHGRCIARAADPADGDRGRDVVGSDERAARQPRHRDPAAGRGGDPPDADDRRGPPLACAIRTRCPRIPPSSLLTLQPRPRSA